MMTMVETHEIPQQRVSWAIREVASMVTIARQWYAVYRAMVDLNVVKDEVNVRIVGRIKEIIKYATLDRRLSS